METKPPDPNKKCCYNCQFLSDVDQVHGTYPQEYKPRPIAAGARPELLTVDKGRHLWPNTGCGKLVWMPTRDHTQAPTPEMIRRLLIDREDDCFFIPNVDDRTFDAGAELEHRQADRREAEKDRALTRAALKRSRFATWISIAAVTVSAWVGGLSLYWQWWAHSNPYKEPPPLATSEGVHTDTPPSKELPPMVTSQGVHAGTASQPTASAPTEKGSGQP